ncbi:transforming acidic coiled-coil-containing protein 3 [Pleurodeles waltl]
MSLTANDENCEVHLAVDVCDFGFAAPQQTGRTSILRPSQKQNLPKSAVKPMKVSFQTPVRDPLTQKIMTPDVGSKQDCPLIENYTADHAAGSADLGETGTAVVKDSHCGILNPTAYPDDEMPVTSKGAYSIDFDNLDTLNPFASSVHIQNSPAKPLCPSEKSFPGDFSDLKIAAHKSDRPPHLFSNTDLLPSDDQNVIQNAPPVQMFSTELQSSNKNVLDSTKDYHLLDCSLVLNIEGVLNAQEHVQCNSQIDEQNNLLVPKPSAQGENVIENLLCNSEELGLKTAIDIENPPAKPACNLNILQDKFKVLDVVENVTCPSAAKEILNLDIGQLCTFDPFKSGGSKLQSSPLSELKTVEADSTDQVRDSEKHSLASKDLCKLNMELFETIDPLKTGEPQLKDSQVFESKTIDHSALMQSATCFENGAPLSAANELFNLNIEPLDTIDPFKLGGSKLQNSPVCSSKTTDLVHNGEAGIFKPELPDSMELFKIVGSNIKNSLTGDPTSTDLGGSVPPMLNVDQMDQINPSTTKGTKLQSSLSDGSIPGEIDTIEPDKVHSSAVKQLFKLNSVNPDSTDLFKTDGSNITNSPAMESNSIEGNCVVVATDAGKDEPVKAIYKFDPEQIDAVDPFKTGGSKLQNSPVGVAKHTGLEHDLAATVEIFNPESLASTSFSKSEPVKLDFEFSDTAPKKPPPKNLGKRLGTKVPLKKSCLSQVKEVEKSKEMCADTLEEEVPVSKASYGFDWNKFDDPNFNPFGSGGSKISSSPQHSRSNAADETKKEPVLPHVESDPSLQDLRPQASSEFINQETNKQRIADCSQEASECAEVKFPPKHRVNHWPSNNLAREKEEFVSKRGAQLIAHEETDINDDDFKPAAEFGFGQPTEIDYLEQFGAVSFKESALRKQSLYLKFDPLLRESPKKRLIDSSKRLISLNQSCSPLISLPHESLPRENNEEKPKGLDLLGTFTAADPPPFIKDTSSSSDSQFPLPTSTAVGAIVEMLKYSQKDMDAAIEKFRQEEVRVKELEVLEWKKKYEKLSMEYAEMEQIVSEFEGTITQMIEDSLKQKEQAKLEAQKLMLEKQQLQIDLNSTEKSFSELFKRFEKQKEGIEGFRKNEEALKKCVENYAAKVQKEEQRYQALKAHAEEKINKANEEIAQVRGKSKSEVAAFQATLRKEQMRIQSLEQALEQKTKENDELTKICDDLIMKMEKI